MKQKIILPAILLTLLSQSVMAESHVVIEKKPLNRVVLTNEEALTKWYVTNPSRTTVQMFQALYKEQLRTNQKLDRLISLMEGQKVHRH